MAACPGQEAQQVSRQRGLGIQHLEDGLEARAGNAGCMARPHHTDPLAGSYRHQDAHACDEMTILGCQIVQWLARLAREQHLPDLLVVGGCAAWRDETRFFRRCHRAVGWLSGALSAASLA